MVGSCVGLWVWPVCIVEELNVLRPLGPRIVEGGRWGTDHCALDLTWTGVIVSV